MPALHAELRLTPQLEDPVPQPAVLGRGLQTLVPDHPVALGMLDEAQGPPCQAVQAAQLAGDVLGYGRQRLTVADHLHRSGEERHLQADPPLQPLGTQVAVDEAVLVTAAGNAHMLERQVVILAHLGVGGQWMIVAHQAHRAVFAQQPAVQVGRGLIEQGGGQVDLATGQQGVLACLPGAVLQGHTRGLALQCADQQRQHVFGHVVRSGEAETSLTACRVESSRLAQSSQLLQHLTQRLDQRLGVLAEHIAAPLADQQRIIEGFTQMRQLPAQGRLAGAETFGGVTEVLQLQEAVEGTQVSEAQGGEGGVHRWVTPARAVPSITGHAGLPTCPAMGAPLISQSGRRRRSARHRGCRSPPGTPRPRPGPRRSGWQR